MLRLTAFLAVLVPVFACAHKPLKQKHADEIETVSHVSFTSTAEPEVFVYANANPDLLATILYLALLEQRQEQAEALAAPMIAELEGFDYEGELRRAFSEQLTDVQQVSLHDVKQSAVHDPKGALLLTRVDWYIQEGDLVITIHSLMYANTRDWLNASTGASPAPIYRRAMEFSWGVGEYEREELRDLLAETAVEVAAQVREDLQLVVK